MLSSNFHTHTSLCHHAQGSIKEYIESAIQVGIKKLGFSDHAPYLFDGEYYSNFRMLPSQYEGYCREILDAKKEYCKDIEIYLGAEIEYYPKYFLKTLDFIKSFGLEYLLLGQHYLGNENGERISTNKNIDESIVVQYVEQCIEALNTGAFTYFAHPDILSFNLNDEFYYKNMRRLCLEAKKLDIALEINFLGIRGNRCYPSKKFFKIAGECGNKVIYGIDAHDSLSISECNKDKIIADKLVKDCNLTLTDKIKLFDGRIV